MTTTEGKTTAHDASSGASSSAPDDVAIGDMFIFAAITDGEAWEVTVIFAAITDGEAWEVTAKRSALLWRLDCGGAYTFATAAQLLDPIRFRRVRAL